MSRNVEIEIFKIAQTRVNPTEVLSWLEHLGASPEYRRETADIMGISGDVTDPALLIAIAAKRCYMSFEPSLNPNVTKVRKDWTEYLDNVLKSGHGSVCEHATYTFAIEGVSRVFTGEMNRHRAGVGISEGSMRYIRYRDIPYWMPTSIRLTDLEKESIRQMENEEDVTKEAGEAYELARKKQRSQFVFRRHFNMTEAHYAELQEIWKDELAPESKFHGKKEITSMVRRIIPMGVATGGVWTLNMRALRHIIALRASPAAEEEILYVFSRIAKMMVESEPMLFGDFSQTTEGFWAPKYSKV
jgi:thymidylate synthase (FAD)